MQHRIRFHNQNAELIRTAEELAELLRSGDKRLSSRLQIWGACLRGTPAWKATRKAELNDLINTIGLPTSFITYSAADRHWEMLHKIILRHLDGRADAYKDNNAKYTRRKGVVDNPHAASAFCARRRDAVLRSAYGRKLRDYWAIYEWQSRGSARAHGLLWMADEPRGIPHVDDLLKTKTTSAAEARRERSAVACDAELEGHHQTWRAYCDGYISGVNPAVVDPPRPEGQAAPDYDIAYYANPVVEPLPRLRKHPCAYSLGELPAAADLKYLANFCNRHIKCRPGVCLRKPKDGSEQCKTGAPWPTGSTGRFVQNRKGKMESAHRRNDPLLNNVPTEHFLLWRANADLKAATSRWALMQYLAKYLTMGEPSSGELKSAAAAVLQAKGPDAKASSAYIKALNKAHQRDVSAQEVSRHALKLPAHHCSRSFAIAGTSDELDPISAKTKPSAYEN